jgi:hypothetical protein
MSIGEKRTAHFVARSIRVEPRVRKLSSLCLEADVGWGFFFVLTVMSVLGVFREGKR